MHYDDFIGCFAWHPHELQAYPCDRQIQLVINQHVGWYQTGILDNEVRAEPTIDPSIWSYVEERAERVIRFI